MKTFKKIVCTILVVLMLLTSAPMQGFVGMDIDIDMPDWFSGKAAAVNVNYCSTAAAQWAIDHWRDYYSVLYNRGYWDDGGDCANFVSQCLYMGGLDMDIYWNISGYKAHWGTYYGDDYSGSYIRCQQLYNYLVKIGAQVIRNPKASDVSIGDVILYSREGASRMTHTAIVIDIKNGQPVVAAHSTGKVMYRSDEAGYEWHLNFKPERTYLMKMNGSTCVNQNHKSFDVYVATGSDTRLYKSTSTSSGYYNTFLSGSNPDYAHVYKKSADGNWGYTFRYGSWGWIRLSHFKYLSHQESPKVSHNFGPWTVAKASNCREDGYDKRICSRCGYEETRTTKGGHVIDPKATCLSWGYCKICGEACEAPLDHDWDNGTVIVQPTCTEDGVRKFVCRRDSSHTYTAVEPKLGHNYATGYTAPSCVDHGETILTCTRCKHSYVSAYNADKAWTDWTTDTSMLSQLSSDRIKTKTQYRYYNKETTTSYETSLSGWTQNGGSWVHQSTNSFNYASFPSGFDTGHWIYTNFHKSCDVGAYENTTNKREVSTSWAGYVYWHWMYDTSYANGTSTRAIFNRSGTGNNGYGYKYFGAFTSSKGDYSSSTGYCNSLGITNYIVPERTSWNDCQGATRWFRFDYYSCTYKDYRKLFNYWRWSPTASAWQDSYIASTNDIKVETRTLYSYNLSALGHNFTVAVDDEFVATDDICYVSGKKCSRCSVYDPGSTTHPHNYPAFDKNNSEWKIINQTETITVYRAYCRNGCGKYIDKTENNCVWTKEILAPTCTNKGYTFNKCTVHPGSHDFESDYIDALGHKVDPASEEIIKAATCTEDGIKRVYCCRYDEGVTCDYCEDTPIPAFGHTMTKYDSIAVTCLADGQTEYYQCETCRKFYADEGGKTELQQDDWIIKAAGAHVDAETVEWELVTPNGCGVTGWEQKSCNRVLDGEVCGAIIDEREIPEIPADYYVSYADNAEFVDGEWKPTSCLEDGILYITCRNCEHTDKAHSSQPDVVYEQEPLERLPHAPGNKDIIKEAYCIYPGQYEIHCTRCTTLLEEGEIPAPCESHNLVEVKAEGGCVYSKCTNAPCTYTEGGAHNFQRDTARDKSATCTEDGLEAYTCSKCGESDDKILDMFGHDHVFYKKIDPTCTEGGYSIYKCLRVNNGTECGDEYPSDYTEPLGHDLIKTDAVAPLCTTDGNFDYYTCQREYCKKIFFDEEALKETTIEYTVDPQIGHDWDDGVINPESTCKDHGTKTYTCQNDNSHKKTEAVELNPDNHIGETYIKDVKSETCTEDGYTGDKHCSDCDELLESGEPIDKLGHDMSKWNSNNDATHTRECQRENGCTYTENEKCSLGDWIVTKEATCTEKGLKERLCTVCGYKETAEIEFKEHTPDEAVIENRVAPKCEEKGSYDQVVYCTECPKELSREEKEIPAHGHDYHKVDEKSKAPDYGVAGYDYYECSYDASHNYKVDFDALVKKMFTATFYVTAPFWSEPKFVDSVPFEQGATYVDEPKVESYDNYTFEWEDYKSRLKDEDITIYGAYTLIEPDNVTELESKKEAKDLGDGIANITLEARADSKTIKVVTANPVDVILVLDQSGSMADSLSSDGKTKKRDALVKCANDFVKALYKNAKETGLDHKVALVGFSYSDYNSGNYKNTELLATPSGKSINYANIKNSDYKSALMSVVTADGVNANITKGINSVVAEGATAAHLGLEMAKNIFSVADKTADRERIVLFITDGTPTSWGETTDLVKDTAAEAITEANSLKNEQGAIVYSIGVHANADPDAEFTSDEFGVKTDYRGIFKSYDFNRFLHAVSSNYPNAGSIKVSEMGEGNKKAGYYFAVNNTDNLSGIFTKILYGKVYEVVSFDKVTLFDTISKEFTLTLEQENEMRERLIKEYGMKNEDITVKRNTDGTTSLRFENVRVQKVFNADSSMYYSAKVSFNVSANEASLGKMGEVKTNTEDAGIEYDGTAVDRFEVQSINLEADRKIVVFTINGVVYRIDEANLGERVVAPVTEFAQWNIPESTVVTGNCAVFEANVIDSKEYVVTWNSEGTTKTETYSFGSVITAPQATDKEGYDFLRWSPTVPETMPNYNMSFTAIYTPEHIHQYNEIKNYGKCTEGIKTVYKCVCGDSYEEIAEVKDHSVKAVITKTGEGTLIEKVTCDVCGASNGQEIIYKVTYSENSQYGLPKTYVLDLSLKERDILVQPDGTIKIRFYLGENIDKNYMVKRIDENGNSYNYTPIKENGYLIFDADHFSFYVITEIDETTDKPSEELSYDEIYCISNGHSYTLKVTAPTCTVKGYTTHTCTSCGDVYTDSETSALGHKMSAYVVTKHPTCTDKGTEISTCTVCTHTETRTINAKGHNYKDGVCTGCGKNKVENCTHMCHKGGFMGFIWKIVRFFWKLFKMNPVCDCGTKHY